MSGQTAVGQPKRIWLDLGDFGTLLGPSDLQSRWQDHGLGLLRTILHMHGLRTDLASTRTVSSWPEVLQAIAGYDVLLMNVRSYTFPLAYRAAQLFKLANPRGLVIVGGMHASVALDEMVSIESFDKICQGAGEGVIVDLVRDPQAFPRVVQGKSAPSLADWPIMDRRLWPRPPKHSQLRDFPWPLENSCGWGPPPVATTITSRVCPWQCSFCNESSYIPNMGRRPVDMVIDELNYLDRTYGPLGSVVIHDSMFFQNPSWLKEWLDKYPRKTNYPWPYWAAARADTVRKWPDLFEALVRETNWRTVSIGFESGSDRVLKTLNKECTLQDNFFTIDLLNRIGDDFERQGKTPPFFWTNIILAVPGETREDAFDTCRMVKFIKRQMVSCAFYAPYPGSVLGHQLIAEGKSLMTRENYHRFANDEKVQGIDYGFYADLMAGKYEAEVLRGMNSWIERGQAVYTQPSSATGKEGHAPHHIYLFDLKNGRKKLAYGSSPDDALNTLRYRLSEEEMAEIVPDKVTRIPQRSLQEHVPVLG